MRIIRVTDLRCEPSPFGANRHRTDRRLDHGRAGPAPVRRPDRRLGRRMRGFQPPGAVSGPSFSLSLSLLLTGTSAYFTHTFAYLSAEISAGCCLRSVPRHSRGPVARSAARGRRSGHPGGAPAGRPARGLRRQWPRRAGRGEPSTGLGDGAERIGQDRCGLRVECRVRQAADRSRT